MMFLFQFTDNDWKSLFIGLITTFFGFLLPLIVYAIRQKRRRQKEREKELQRIENEKKIEDERNDKILSDRIEYFRLLLEGAKETTKRQCEFILEFIAELMKAPLTATPLKKGAKKDLARIEKMDGESIFLAYKHIFKEDTRTAYEFSEIFKSVDFISESLDSSYKTYKNYIQNTHRHQSLIKNDLESLTDEVSIIMYNIKKEKSIVATAQSTYNDLNEFLLKYNELNQHQPSLAVYRDQLIRPFRDKLYKEHQDEAYFRQIFFLTKKLLVKFTDFEFSSNEAINEFQQFHDDIKNELNRTPDLLNK